MREQRQIDRYLIVFGSLILTISALGFFFETELFGKVSIRKEGIGRILKRSGDIRLKYSDSLEWVRATHGQALMYEDTVFVGSGASTEIQMGNNKLQISENSLVVLRQRNNAQLIDLSYGSMIAQISQGEKVILKDFQGEEFEVSSNKSTGFIVQRGEDGSLDLEVQSGEVISRIRGQKTKVTKSQKLKISKGGTELAEPEIRLVEQTEPVYSSEEHVESFRWRYLPESSNSTENQFWLEFSLSPDFSEIKKTVDAQDKFSTKLRFQRSTHLFYRVRNNRGKLSDTGKFEYVKMERPQLISPVAQQKIYRAPSKSSPLKLNIVRPDSALQTQVQISRSEDFESTVFDEITWQDFVEGQLGYGSYFWRARAIYPKGRQGDWSRFQSFEILTPATPTPDLPLADTLEIPAMDLTDLTEEEQRERLQEAAFSDVFGGLKKQQRLELRFADRGVEFDLETQRSWPREMIRPGIYQLSYRIQEPGYKKSKWTTPQRILMLNESPREVDPTTVTTSLTKWTEKTIRWSPVPLTNKYQVQLSETVDFGEAQNITTSETDLSLRLLAGDSYFWRVRTLSDSENPTSRFSPTYSVKTKKSDELIARLVRPAQKKTKEEYARYPAETNHNEKAHKSESAKNLSDFQKPAPRAPTKSGWSVWLGSGFNYVNAQQNSATQGSFTFETAAGPSFLAEAGFQSKTGYGGRASYKTTPGSVDFGNVAVVPQKTYQWVTTSVDFQKAWMARSPMFGYEWSYGLRFGLQDHKVPLVELINEQGQTPYFELREMSMQTAAAGFLTEFSKGRSRYHLEMRYQYPFSTQASGLDGFTVKPEFAFDGLIGTSYIFSGGLKLGWFWYGQWHKYQYSFLKNSTPASGAQSLFYSNTDLRIGYDF